MYQFLNLEGADINIFDSFGQYMVERFYMLKI